MIYLGKARRADIITEISLRSYEDNMFCKGDRWSCKVTSVTPVRKIDNMQLGARAGIHRACPPKNAGQVLVARSNGISTNVCVLVYFLSESYKKTEVEEKWRHSQERWKECNSCSDKHFPCMCFPKCVGTVKSKLSLSQMSSSTPIPYP